MRCAPGTHEMAAKMLAGLVPLSSRTIELGIGSGAFLARLQDMGFRNIEGADLHLEQCDISGVALQQINFNHPFANHFQHRFSVAVAIEVVEHLESPRSFLREVRGLLEDDGYLLLSTPNIAHWMGRLHFLLTGQLRYFDDRIYYEQRHISVIPNNHVKLLLSEIGFQVVAVRTTGTFLRPFAQILTSPLSLLGSFLFGNNSNGDVSLYLAQSCQPDNSTPGQNPDYVRWYS